jgi:hypothetical protein
MRRLLRQSVKNKTSFLAMTVGLPKNRRECWKSTSRTKTRADCFVVRPGKPASLLAMTFFFAITNQQLSLVTNGDSDTIFDEKIASSGTERPHRNDKNIIVLDRRSGRDIVVWIPMLTIINSGETTWRNVSW